MLTRLFPCLLSSQVVAPGNVLVYATCSLNKGENDEVVSRFERRFVTKKARSCILLFCRHKHAQASPSNPPLPQHLCSLQASGAVRELAVISMPLTLPTSMMPLCILRSGLFACKHTTGRAQQQSLQRLPWPLHAPHHI
jgi:hypothetical protein